MKKLFDTKKKKIIAATIVVILLISACTIPYLMKEETYTLSLKDTNTITIEYGTPFEMEEPIQYLNTENVSDALLEEVSKKLTVNELETNDDGILELGEHTIIFVYMDQSVEKTVLVQDTTKPVFEDVKDISIEEGESYDFEKNIKATDLTDVTITFSEVDLTKTGEHKVTATATDSSGNIATKDINIEVTKKEVEETPTASNSSGNSSSSSSSGSSSNTSSSSGSSSSSSGSSSNTTTPEVEEPSTPSGGYDYKTGDLGILFDSFEEAGDYMDNVYMMDVDNLREVYGYGVHQTYDKFYVSLKYR